MPAAQARIITAKEPIIVIPARLPAPGLLAGGMLLLLACLPAHGASYKTQRSACDNGALDAESCQSTKQAPRSKPLKASTRCECTRIDGAIRDNEKAEQRIGARGVMESLQHDVISLRKRYRELRC